MLEDNEDYQLINSKFPHIGQRLKWSWGDKSCPEYIHKLFFDNRNGERQGFPRDVASSLFKLSQLHDQLFPAANKGHSWEDNFNR